MTDDILIGSVVQWEKGDGSIGTGEVAAIWKGRAKEGSEGATEMVPTDRIPAADVGRRDKPDAYMVSFHNADGGVTFAMNAGLAVLVEGQDNADEQPFPRRYHIRKGMTIVFRSGPLDGTLRRGKVQAIRRNAEKPELRRLSALTLDEGDVVQSFGADWIWKQEAPREDEFSVQVAVSGKNEGDPDETWHVWNQDITRAYRWDACKHIRHPKRVWIKRGDLVVLLLDVKNDFPIDHTVGDVWVTDIRLAYHAVAGDFTDVPEALWTTDLNRAMVQVQNRKGNRFWVLGRDIDGLLA